jgi:peptidoglycan/LPS O-acetylase OafA/YrhL
VSHFEVFPLFAGVDTGNKLGRLLVHGWSTLFYGLPAVIVFFVISGFCIHLPFRHFETLSIGKYYARRYTRILVPVAGALAVYWLVGQKIQFWGEHSILWESVLWSLLCEEIYYFVYPLLLYVRQKYNWLVIIAPLMLLSVILGATKPNAESFHDFGPLKTAMMLYPVWLLGCVLAEQVERPSVLPSKKRIVGWRLLAWFGCWAVCILHFHSPIRNMQTSMWFGVIAYFWIKNEIAYGNATSPPKWMAWAGAWSYSLYLMHGPALEILRRLQLPYLGPLVNWILTMAFVCFYSYVFYLLIERPSHQFARRIRVIGATKPKRAAVVVADSDSLPHS